MKPRKIIAVFTVLCMLLSQSTSFASAAGSAVTEVTPCHVTCVNPLYADVITESDLIRAADAPAALSGSDEYFTTVAEAGACLREGMEARLPVVEINYQTDTYSDELGNALFASFLETALEHTGNPTEGDYIRWQYAGYQGSMSGSISGGTYYLTYTYTITYHSDAEQEAAVDAAVDDLLGSLDLSGGDYEKICAAYDWICRNITYDYENLEDDTYTRKYTAYAALLDRTAVCQGYAVLLYRLALEMGIDCRLISGIGNGGAHGWNIIKVGDVYYNADSTWDAGRDSYSYFLKCGNNFPDHVRDAEYETGAFHAAYPMSTVDYGETAEPEQPDDAEVIASGTCGEGLTWKLTDDGRLTISGTGAMADYDWSGKDIPWYGFRESISSIVVNEGVSSIGRNAFLDCYCVASVQLPSSLEEISSGAFRGCSSLHTIHIPEGVVTSSGIFSGCDLLADEDGYIVIDNCLYEYIGESLYLTIPDGVKTIKRDSLHCNHANQVLSISIPDSVETLESGAMGTLTYSSVKTLTIGNGLHTLPDSAFTAFKSLESVTLPKNLEAIPNYLFNNCSSLTEIVIPETVTSIGQGAFAGCTSLESIVIPQNVNHIETYAFYGCIGLTEIVLPPELECYPDLGTDSLKRVVITGPWPGQWSWASSKKNYTPFYGYDCEIYYRASDSSTWTTEVKKMIDSGASIRWKTYCYYDWDNYCMVDHNGSDYVLGKAASCTEPGEETGVCSTCGAAATREIAALGHDYVDTVTAPTCTEQGWTIHVCTRCNDSYVDTYVDASGHTFVNGYCVVCGAKDEIASGTCGENLTWSLDSKGTLTISGTGEMENWEYSFDVPWDSVRDQISTIIISDGVTSIGDHAFDYCSNVTSVSIGSDVSSIGIRAFAGNGFSTAILPDGVVSIGRSAFSDCSKLTSIAIPDSVTSLGGAAFWCCTNLTDVKFGSGVITIESATFENCTSLTSVVFPKNICKIQNAFYGCTGLSSITFEGDAPEIAEDTFCDVTATAYYSADNSTWTADVMQNYGGKITWVPMFAITDGANSVLITGCTGELTIRVDHDVSMFTGVLLDGVEVDPSNYTVSEDSAAVTFKPEFLETLATGAHYVVLQFTDGVAATKFTVADFIPGDINGDGKVTSLDAARLMQYLAGWDVNVVAAALDVNGDGKVTTLDAARLMQYLAGWDVEIH